jgi:hypothetical protein
MAFKKITITEDHVKLLQAIKFESFVFDGDSRNGRIGWGIDQYAPWGGNFPIEDIALILGHWEDAIKGTENDYDGRKFPKALETRFFYLYKDITENMEYMFSLLIFYSDKGGLKPGIYKCNPRLKDWVKVSEE